MHYFNAFSTLVATVSCRDPFLRDTSGRKTQNPPARSSSGGGLDLLLGFALGSAASRARKRTRKYANNSYESRQFLAWLQHGVNLAAGSTDVNGTCVLWCRNFGVGIPGPSLARRAWVPSMSGRVEEMHYEASIPTPDPTTRYRAWHRGAGLIERLGSSLVGEIARRGRADRLMLRRFSDPPSSLLYRGKNCSATGCL